MSQYYHAGPGFDFPKLVAPRLETGRALKFWDTSRLGNADSGLNSTAIYDFTLHGEVSGLKGFRALFQDSLLMSRILKPVYLPLTPLTSTRDLERGGTLQDNCWRIRNLRRKQSGELRSGQEATGAPLMRGMMGGIRACAFPSMGADN